MARTIGIPCADCRQRFGGDETFRRHRFLAGDRYRCRTDAELRSRGLWRDEHGVWHRGPIPAQLSLLGPAEADRGLAGPSPLALARINDPDTSHAAAAALSGRAGTIRRRLLVAYCDDGHGLTAEEAAARVGLGADDGPWKRVSDLLNAGLLVDTGDRRPGSSGRLQRVLTVTALGREAVGV